MLPEEEARIQLVSPLGLRALHLPDGGPGWDSEALSHIGLGNPVFWGYSLLMRRLEVKVKSQVPGKRRGKG